MGLKKIVLAAALVASSTFGANAQALPGAGLGGLGLGAGGLIVAGTFFIIVAADQASDSK